MSETERERERERETEWSCTYKQIRLRSCRQRPVERWEHWVWTWTTCGSSCPPGTWTPLTLPRRRGRRSPLPAAAAHRHTVMSRHTLMPCLHHAVSCWRWHCYQRRNIQDCSRESKQILEFSKSRVWGWNCKFM